MNIELKNVKHYESMSEETYCFEASLYVDGERVGAVSNRGIGGCHDYDFDSKTETKLNEWCKANLPKWSMFDDEEYDTDLELHISNLVTEFLDSKHLKSLLNKAVMVMDDRCQVGEAFEWKFSKYKGRPKADVVRGVMNVVNKREEFVNPVVLNAMPFKDARSVYFKK